MVLMILWLTIFDEWLGCEGNVLVVGVFIRLFSLYENCVVSGELLLKRSFVKGEYVGVTWEI